MSLLEERIKRSQKNRPVIKKPSEVEAATVRPGGRPNRVNPVPASQPSPVVRESGIPDPSSQQRRYVLLTSFI